MLINDNQFLYVEKYRPQTLDECILPEKLKEYFKGFVTAGEIPNLIIDGRPGIGKTSVVMAMLNEMNKEYLKINGSLKNGIDAVRNDIAEFASSYTFNGGRKYILLDEGDGMNENAQNALKSLIEEFSGNAGFIITCNDKKRLNEAFQSRFSTIDFTFGAEEFKGVATAFFERVKAILDNEGVTYDPKVLAAVIRRHYPDCRKTLNQLQAYANKHKTIDVGILSTPLDVKYAEIVSILKEKRWDDMRKWVVENYESVTEFSTFGRRLFKMLEEAATPKSLPSYIVLLSEYDYKQAFVSDREINVMSFLTQVMGELEWRNT